MFNFPLKQQGKQGFTLAEILCVIAIMSILVAGAATATGFLGSANITSSLARISDLFSMAQRYARGQNTYVWVAFSSPITGSGAPKVAAIVLASKDGTDALGGTSYLANTSGWNGLNSTAVNLDLATGAGSDITVVSTVQFFSNVQTTTSAATIDPLIPNIPSAASVHPFATCNLTHKVGGQTITFTQLVEFTPQGLAKVNTGFLNPIEFDVQPALGTSNNVAAIRLNGLTGTATIYRP